MTPVPYIPVLALTLMMLSACGGGADPASSPSPSPPPSDPTVSVRDLSTTAHTVSLPLTNGRGVAVADVPVTLHAEDGTLYATRWTATGTEKTQLATDTGGATLAGEGNDLLAVYTDLAGNAMRARVSDDGGASWSAPVRLGDRPAGPPLPTACVYSDQGQRKRVVAWSAQPSESDGPLTIVLYDGTQWLAPVEHSTIRSSGAALHCSATTGVQVVWRDHRDGSTGTAVALWTAQVSATGALENASKLFANAFDPSFCRSGTTRWVGHHSSTNDAHLSSSTDGASWSEADSDGTQAGTQSLDDDGKFVAAACAGEVVVAAWGDWPTKQDANDRANTRRLGVLFSRDGGGQWFQAAPDPQGSEQGPATAVATADGGWVVWNEGSTVRLAEIR